LSVILVLNESQCSWTEVGVFSSCYSDSHLDLLISGSITRNVSVLKSRTKMPLLDFRCGASCM